jgi:thymidylate kinase
MGTLFENNVNPFVLLEGMDFSGKSSTVEALLRKNLTWEKNHLNLAQENEIHLFAKKINKQKLFNSEIIGNLYVTALTVDIEKFVWPKNPTMQDSCTLLRSLAHHTAYNNIAVVRNLKELAEKHPNFSNSFVFTVDIKQRQKRLIDRLNTQPASVSASDYLVIKNPELFEVMNSTIIEYAKLYFNAEIIDTGSTSFDEVVNFIHKRINQDI